jgi:hypothetical protein
VGDDLQDRGDYSDLQHRYSIVSRSGAGNTGSWKIAITVLAALGLALAAVAMVFALHSQSALSHAQQQAAAAERQVSALKSEVSADRSELDATQSDLQTLQGTVNGLSSLSAFTSKVCNDSGVYDDNTGQTVTVYYPCTDDNPNG